MLYNSDSIQTLHKKTYKNTEWQIFVKKKVNGIIRTRLLYHSHTKNIIKKIQNKKREKKRFEFENIRENKWSISKKREEKFFVFVKYMTLYIRKIYIRKKISNKDKTLLKYMWFGIKKNFHKYIKFLTFPFTLMQ